MVRIGQTRLSLSFGLANVVQSLSGRNSCLRASNLVTSVVYTLASKVLHISLITTMEWSSFGIQPAKVSHLVGRILKGKTSPSSLTMAQATADLHTTEDPEEVARRQGKFAAEAIASFDAHASDSQMPTTSYDSPASVGATYLSDVVARPACERRGIRLGVLRIANDFDILIVSRARGNIIWVAPQYVMMDSGV